jgi:DNA-binding transcriptional ArsR family regulator
MKLQTFGMAVMDERLLKKAKQQADVCQVFGSSTRILILWVLNGREMRVGDIATAIEASLQNTSQHLRLMKDRGILTSRRTGHAIYYRINGNELVHGCPVLCQTIEMPVPVDEALTINPPE